MAVRDGKREYTSLSKKTDWELIKNTKFVKLIRKNINSKFDLYSTLNESTFYLTNDMLDYLGYIEIEYQKDKSVVEIIASNSGIKSGFYNVMFTAIGSNTNISMILSDYHLSDNAVNSYEKLARSHILNIVVKEDDDYITFSKENLLRNKYNRVAVIFDNKFLKESQNKFSKSLNKSLFDISKNKNNLNYLNSKLAFIHEEERRYLYGEAIDEIIY